MEKSTKTQMKSPLENEEKAQYLSQVLQLIHTTSFSMVLYNAVKLKLLEIIGEGNKLSSAQIASRLPAGNPDAAASMIDRMLLLLTSYSVCTCDVVEIAAGGDDGTVHYERVYGLSPVGEFFVPDKEGNTIAPMVELIQDKILIDGWYELKDAVVEGGIAANRSCGMSFYEYAGRDTRFNDIMNKGMVSFTSITESLLLSKYEGFETIETLVDVGGGYGKTLHFITSKFPSIKGINFDLPQVVRDAPSYPGIKHIEGDMLEGVPQGDAILMKIPKSSSLNSSVPQNQTRVSLPIMCTNLMCL